MAKVRKKLVNGKWNGKWLCTYRLAGERYRPEFDTKIQADSFKEKLLLRPIDQVTGFSELVEKPVKAAFAFYFETESKLKATGKEEKEFINEFGRWVKSFNRGRHDKLLPVLHVHDITSEHMKLYQFFLSQQKAKRFCGYKVIDGKRVKQIRELNRLVTPARVNRKFNFFRDFFRFAKSHRWTRENPVAEIEDLSIKSRKRKAWSDGQYHQVSMVMTARNRDALEFADETGGRAGALQKFTFSDINWELGKLGQITLLTQKGRTGNLREYQFPITKRMKALLLKKIEEAKAEGRYHPDEPVFWSDSGKPITTITFSKAVERAIAKAGLSSAGISLHGIRHRWAQRMKKAGAATSTIKDGLGHASVLTTESYLEEDQDELLDKLEGIEKPGTTGHYRNESVNACGDQELISS